MSRYLVEEIVRVLVEDPNQAPLLTARIEARIEDQCIIAGLIAYARDPGSDTRSCDRAKDPD